MSTEPEDVSVERIAGVIVEMAWTQDNAVAVEFASKALLSARRKGREEGLEEAAKKAEETEWPGWNDPVWPDGHAIAEAIRSLKGKQP